MLTGKCPNPACGRTLQNLLIETPNIQAGIGFNATSYKGATVLCPNCRTIISASIDPIALKADVVAEVKKALGR